MTGKFSPPPISHVALWHILLVLADFRIPIRICKALDCGVADVIAPVPDNAP